MSDAFLAGGGAASRMILERDWSDHPLGPIAGWPSELRAALSLILNSPESMILAWGPDLSFFFNETYFPLLGPRLPWAMGERFDKVWADAWTQAKPIIDAAFEGRSQRFVDLPWTLDTDRGVRDTWWSFSYSRVLDAHGEVAGLFIFTNETTARVLSDQALMESQSQLRTANETLERLVEARTTERDLMWTASPDLMVVIDAKGVFHRANPAWTQLLGYEPHELVGRHVNEFVLAGDHQETVDAYLLAAKGGSPRIVNRYRHKDGSVRSIAWVAIPNGDVTYAFGRDVTEERERAEALRLAEEALRQSQKMEAVGQLTGGLAHDFNNLLAGISGSLDMIQTRIREGRVGELDRYVVGAQGAARRAAALTHRLLAFSRRQTLEPKPTDVNRLVAGMEDLVRRTVGPQIAVETRPEPRLWPALVDPNQLENALLNLCINARDAMPDGGRIRIETANHRLDEQAALETDLSPGDYLALCVTDTGTGMTADVVERAFDPFFTTKPIGVGTGLGLSMIYGFTRQSGGQVRIRSDVGVGTAVCIYLPRHDEEEAIEAVAPITLHRGDNAGRTVLVVDDEPLVRMLVVDAVEDLGFSAIEAEDGVEALEALRSGASIDLLVTDVGLPNGMNGRQVADAARELRPGLKVLFVTGYAENAVLNDGHLDPGMQVVTKPFDMTGLSNRIQGMVGD
ncbi:hybrid sensor histidine kinase/response regulator [Aureimonas phyllosphaerae]|uniref:histidine kinase n=1 Tax=Aureimonas phyllosphaerae TaxID=1166078 RepID=A0A7W6BTN0_9HYPH|nr:PAS domain-containing protein [Aureimonas phyllosphaerae]MBB3937804.1 PAS domain S-box-containing protein [Aureimonas phyllosphaerae]MBB3961865.1 PAS domain S-box-containing protein [Aureimonas phyllosphaerae]SFF51056.1 PAS/PAC sensor hybrid histidine kinase [Aureimonas phyllosphaerae]